MSINFSRSHDFTRCISCIRVGLFLINNKRLLAGCLGDAERNRITRDPESDLDRWYNIMNVTLCRRLRNRARRLKLSCSEGTCNIMPPCRGKVFFNY